MSFMLIASTLALSDWLPPPTAMSAPVTGVAPQACSCEMPVSNPSMALAVMPSILRASS
jgi:hypothetical protein